MNWAQRTVDYLVMALAAVASALSIALFAWDDRPMFVPLAWPPADALAWNAGLSLLFFIQHSGMVRRGFRARAARFVPARYGGTVYAITSGLTLLLVVVLWQRVDIPVFTLAGAARWITMAAAAAVAGLMVYAAFAVRRTIDFLGVGPIRAHMRGEVPRALPFFVAGPYRWVRHPLYACVLALLWLRPEMMADGLLLSLLWSGWILAGTWLEERDLVAEFGDAYREYQRRVPMLVPWRRPVDAVRPPSE